MNKHDHGFRLGRPALGLALLTFILSNAVLLSWSIAAQKAPAEQMALLKGTFDLGAARSQQVQYFRQETQFVHIGFDGKRTGAETYILKLKCLPAAMSGKDGDEYTCREFRLRLNDGPELTVPSLAKWSYIFTLNPEGKDEKGQVLGIPHAKFEGLTDSRGNKLAAGLGYAVYNNFIDFHSFNDIFARPATGGPGIQDLKAIGQRIIHAAAFSEPPVNLGAGIKEGSVFRNGEVSLEFKGLSIIDGAACALVGYDSGESTLKMIMPVGPDKDIVTVGGSEYKGDLFIDLATHWVRKVTMDEFVVTETTMPGPAPKIDAYTVRHLLMRMINQGEFEKD
jgi:hypothetical protein